MGCWLRFARPTSGANNDAPDMGHPFSLAGACPFGNLYLFADGVGLVPSAE